MGRKMMPVDERADEGRICVQIGPRLLEELDQFLLRTDQVNRSQFIRRAIVEELRRDRRRWEFPEDRPGEPLMQRKLANGPY